MSEWQTTGSKQSRKSGSGERGGGAGRGGRGQSSGRGRGGAGRSGGAGRDSGFSRKGGGGGSKTKPVDATRAISNVLRAKPSAFFRFYKYGISSNTDGRRRRQELFEQGLKNIGTKFDPRTMFFEGSQVFSIRPITGLDNFPKSIVTGGGSSSAHASGSEVDHYLTVEHCIVLGPPIDVVKEQSPTSEERGIVATDSRCSDCAKTFAHMQSLLQHCQISGHSPVTKVEVKPSSHEEFILFCNLALRRAMLERMTRWGNSYIDPKTFRDEHDIRIFDAYSAEFSLIKDDHEKDLLCLGLTIDVGVKIQRRKSLLDMLNEMGCFDSKLQKKEAAVKRATRLYEGESVVYTIDKRTFDIVKLRFDCSPTSLNVKGLNMSHTAYFEKKKKIKLKYPNSVPMIEVLGRNNESIFLPCELVCVNELDPDVKMKLPMIASFRPDQRNKCIEEMKRFLIAGAQKSKGEGNLLPSMGITLDQNRIQCGVKMLPIPLIRAGNININVSRDMDFWAPQLGKVDYSCKEGAVKLVPVIVHSKSIKPNKVIDFIRKEVNKMNSKYIIGTNSQVITHSGNQNDHWRSVVDYLRKVNTTKNLFVIDLTKPSGSSLDTAYPVVKSVLAENGIVSQFINFKTCDHNGGDVKKSSQILYSVCRQILAKCGVRIWWVSIPPEVPLPAVFIGVDVFHAPRKFDLETRKRVAKKSVAACVVQIIRSARKNEQIEVYTETMARDPGKELNLGEFLHQVTRNALKTLKVDPKSCFVWRDGVGETQLKTVAQDEIPKIKLALSGKRLDETVTTMKSKTGKSVPVSYTVCQKRITTKFLANNNNNALALNPGAAITSIQGPEYNTFYIVGTSPPFSTPKPVRFVEMKTDEELKKVNLPELTWSLCHDYPNWTGPVKLPAPTQNAHKLAELVGSFADCGESIDSNKYANKLYFL